MKMSDELARLLDDFNALNETDKEQAANYCLQYASANEIYDAYKCIKDYIYE